MISPAAVPPSAAAPKKSGATWLDRLRSSRGFPPPDAADLDHFLAVQTLSPGDPPRLESSNAVDASRGAQNGRVLGDGKEEHVADILSQLFAMGGGGGGGGESSNCASNRRKSSRKQLNPRFWDGTGSSKKSSNGGSSDDLRRRNNTNNNNPHPNLASSGDNSLNQRLKGRDSKVPVELGVQVEEEEEEAEADLKGYSKSEVTVIDSSVQGWRTEMFVFRKKKSKSVWMAREKKSESRSLIRPRRKRKSTKSNSSNDDDDDDDDDDDGDEDDDVDDDLIRLMKKKKKMVRVSDSAPGNCKEDAVMPLINEGQVWDDKVDQTLLRGEAPVNSFPCSSSHWKSKNGSSSVILVKPISAFDKIGTRKPGKMSITKGQRLA